MTSPELKFLTGAPTPTALNWSEEGLLKTFSSALQRHLNYAHSAPPPPPTPTPTQPVARWRSIPLTTNKTFHETSLLREEEQPHANISAKPRQINHLKADHDDFLDHSFALEANLQSSQIASHHHSLEDDDPEEATFMTDDSIYSTNNDDFETTFISTAGATKQDSGPQSAISSYRPVGPIMSIKAVPTAEYLQRIQPQTMTVNLLVGIISVGPARTVTTRNGHDMDIIELTVGDETKAGFTISSWHRAQDSHQRHKVEDQSRSILSSLRPQDVVLIERVALSSFRNAVFGQSLNRRATKNTTAFTILHKAHSLRSDGSQQTSFPRAVDNKLERVCDWVSSFIGPSAKRKAQSEPLPQAGSKKKARSNLIEEFLPADSQP
jgi:hypothetical protein